MSEISVTVWLCTCFFCVEWRDTFTPGVVQRPPRSDPHVPKAQSTAGDGRQQGMTPLC